MSVIHKVADSLAEQIYQAAPDKTNKEIVQYFFIRIFTQAVFFLFLIPLALLLHIDIAVTVIVLVSYMVLRRCWGGAHLENDIACLALSIITVLLAAWLATLIEVTITAILMFYMVSFLIVKWTDVVDSPAKRIVKLRSKFRRQGLITLTILFALNTVLFFMPKASVFCTAVLLGAGMEMVSLIIGKLTYK